jgi:hypothetical protein
LIPSRTGKSNQQLENTMLRILLLAGLTMTSLSVAAAGTHDHHGHAHGAHAHGIAKLEVAIEGNEIHLHLDAPLHDLLGFERAPRNSKERAAADALLKQLGKGEALFRPTSAAQCTLASASIEAPILSAAAGKTPADGHADLEAEYRFTCAQPAKLTGMEVLLSQSFKGLRRVDAQTVTAKKQGATRLTSKMRFLSW